MARIAGNPPPAPPQTQGQAAPAQRRNASQQRPVQSEDRAANKTQDRPQSRQGTPDVGGRVNVVV